MIVETDSKLLINMNAFCIETLKQISQSTISFQKQNIEWPNNKSQTLLYKGVNTEKLKEQVNKKENTIEKEKNCAREKSCPN